MPPPPEISVVVPVFDEREALPAFHEELAAAGASWRPRGWDAVEVVYVDDGSTDGSSELLEKLHLDDPDHVRVVSLRRNFGKSGAMAAGFAACAGEIVVTLDADGQDVPAEVARLLALIDAGEDLVVGWRRTRIDRVVKRWTSRLYNGVTRWLTGLDLHDFNSGLKAMRRDVIEELRLYGELHRYVPVLVADLGFSVAETPVDHRARQAGTSKYLSATRFPKAMLDLLTVVFLTRYADRPLYLFGSLGGLLSIVGMGAIVYLALLKLLTGAGIGARPLLQYGVVTVLLGVQLIGFGFVADVLRHNRSFREPSYRIKRTLP